MFACKKAMILIFLEPKKPNEGTSAKTTLFNKTALFQKVEKAVPKDPAVLKTLRDSELLRRGVFTTPPRFTTPCEPLL